MSLFATHHDGAAAAAGSGGSGSDNDAVPTAGAGANDGGSSDQQQQRLSPMVDIAAFNPADVDKLLADHLQELSVQDREGIADEVSECYE